MSKEKVIIVGAGAAGLMAGRILEKAGIPFIILEASDRVGGRAYTREENFHVEMGPEFLHGETPVTDSLMEEFKLPWYDFKFDYHVYHEGKLTPVPDFWDKLCHILSDIRIDEDLPFNEYISEFDQHPLFDKKLAKSFVQGFDAADLNAISTKALSEMKDQACDPGMRKMRRPLEGYGSLMKNLSASLHRHIRFAHRITEINWSLDSVEVNGTAGEGRVPFSVEGKQIIVTSSLGALKNLSINPMPEEITNFLSQNEMGHVVKMVAELSSEFFHNFKDNTFPFVAAPDHCFSAWWTTTPIHSQLVTGWSGGEKARKLEGKSEAERREVFIQELATISGLCPLKIDSWIMKLHHHNWGADENFSGAYSYPKVVRGERQEAKTVFDDTLIFAGEAFHTEFSGTIEGALLTGKDAAEEIIESRSMDNYQRGFVSIPKTLRN